MSCLFIFIALLLSSCIGSLTALDQTCGNKVVNTIIVDQAGSGKFRTVQAAIDSVGELNSLWIKIRVKRGVYVEKVIIPYNKPCIIVEGEGQRVTTIMYNGHEATDVSSTFTSYPPHIVVRNLSIMNTYYPLNSLTTNANGMDWKIKPAVAISVYGDKSAFYNCDFVGLQDTVWDNHGKHHFKNCYIQGAIDFIFGSGQSVYEDCHINATAGALASEVAVGYITAQGRSSVSDPSGFVFLRGSVSGTTSVYLGRAYGPFSRVIFIQTDLSSVVHPKGWDPWHYGRYEMSFTYAEVECKGAGSDISGRVSWSDKLHSFYAKQQFSISNFIDQDQWISNIPRF
ncbi:Pectin lyase fold/virulence factor [Arabidopsis suecica]|uniref:Pectinesterase n=1 Tax=Arabidopsis suecica TaxID=45249 RepID=A0A8T1ZCA2_ARASU|nr:Pectin lyase fold/virulence factor [Arabidopsis suecica]